MPDSLPNKLSQTGDEKYVAAVQYIRDKVNQLLALMGTLEIRPEELDDDTLLELDPIGIIAGAFEQVLANLHRTNNELTLARNEIRTVFDSFGAAVFVLNRNLIVEDCNVQAARWLFKYPETEQNIGKVLQEICPCELNSMNVFSAVADGASEFRFHDQVYHLVRSSIQNEKGEVEKIVYTCLDITIQKRAEEILASQASTDELTGIANRRMLDRALDIEMQRAERYSMPLAMIMLDIDHFKNINDTQGHQAGDSVLIHLSRLISSMIRGQDLLARWGGEEFIILTPTRDIEGTRKFAEKLRKAIECHDFPGVGRLTCSFGLSGYKPGEEKIEFFRRVDTALYNAKNEGRNRVEIA